ncbi:MAG: hypothetical protein LBU32_13625 [Clostridiales bacterium]|nr:hypothetical protein [Clostridiales bacterium]
MRRSCKLPPPCMNPAQMEAAAPPCKSGSASSAAASNSMEAASFFLEPRFLRFGRDSRRRAPQRPPRPSAGSPRPFDPAALENGRGHEPPAHFSRNIRRVFRFSGSGHVVQSLGAELQVPSEFGSKSKGAATGAFKA